MPSKQPKSAQRERALFSERLKHALTAAGLKTGPTALERAFNERNRELAVTCNATRKWLMGQSIPRRARLQALAETVGVSAMWLGFGEHLPDETGKSLAVQEQLLLKSYRKLDEPDREHVLAIVRSMSRRGRGK